MPSVWQSIQPKLQPDHPQQEAHRLQAVWVRHLLKGLPAKGGSPQAPREPARHEVKRKKRARWFVHIRHLFKQQADFNVI